MTLLHVYSHVQMRKLRLYTWFGHEKLSDLGRLLWLDVYLTEMPCILHLLGKSRMTKIPIGLSLLYPYIPR